MAAIEKVAIYDARLVQTPPVYGVQKGALSVSTSKFAALAASTNQHTYQILVPSLNVFVDRKIVWDSGVYVTSQIYPTLPCDTQDGVYISSSPNGYLVDAGSGSNPAGFGGSAIPALCSMADPRTDLYRRTIGPNSLGNGYPLLQGGSGGNFYAPCAGGEYYEVCEPGANWNLCPFPLQSLCTNMTASINDCSVTTNGDTLQEQILLTNTRATARIRTTPSKFDEYAYTLDDAQALNGNMATYGWQNPLVGSTPNGAWPITFYDPTTGGQGSALGVGGAYVDPSNGQPVYYLNGRPVIIPGGIIPTNGQEITNSGGYFSASCTGNTITFTSASAYNNYAAFPVGAVFLYRSSGGSGDPNSRLTGYYQVGSITYTGVSTTWVTTIVASCGNTIFNGAFTSRSGLTSAATYYVRSQFANSGVLEIDVSKLLGTILPDGSHVHPSPMNLPMTVCLKYKVQEPIVMSPFIYQDALEFNSVGLYGCTNIQFTMNLQSPAPFCQAISQSSWPLSTTSPMPFSQPKLNNQYPNGANIIRSTGVTGAWANVQLQAPLGQQSSGYGPFDTPQMIVQFLTPGPDISLPLISNVPYMEFPRYIKQDQLSTPSASSYQITTQTITLSSIPDILMVFVKSRNRSQIQNETYLPISNVQVTFDNFSNLCANMTQQELFTCSVAAGLDMDWHTWRGFTAPQVSLPGSGGGVVFTSGFMPGLLPASASVSSTTPGPFTVPATASSAFQGVTGTYVPTILTSQAADLGARNGGWNFAGMNPVVPSRMTQTTGGPLMLRMGQDVALSPGLAPGTLGNFSLQLTLTLDNSNGFFNAFSTVQTTIIAVNSGFLETVRGQSAVRKTILNMADVEAAHADSGITTTALRRLVGAGHGFSRHLNDIPGSKREPGMGSRKRANMGSSGLM